MKTFNINIHPKLENVSVTVKNGSKFQKNLIEGNYKSFQFTTTDSDLKRIKKFAVENGNDNNSNRGDWYAHCNGFAMDLLVTNKGKFLFLNTYRPYGQTKI